MSFSRGFSILEILLALFLLGMLVWGTTYMLTKRNQQRITESAQMENELLSLSLHISRVGRFAGTPTGTNCFKPSVGILECNVDMNSPPGSGPIAVVRFAHSLDRVLYQVQSGAGFETRIVYNMIEGLDICTGPELAAGTCTLQPAEINDAHRDFGPALDRFVRYRIRGVASSSLDQQYRRSVYGAFYSRNPDPSNPGVTYMWGSKE